MPPHMILKKLLQRKIARAKRTKDPFSASTCDENDDENLPLSRYSILEVSDIKKENAERTCRVCLSEGKKYIFDNNASGSLATKINEHGRLNVSIKENDNHPKYICEPCYTLLQDAVLFRNMAQESERRLQRGQIEIRQSRNIKMHESDEDIEHYEREESSDMFTADKTDEYNISNVKVYIQESQDGTIKNNQYEVLVEETDPINTNAIEMYNVPLQVNKTAECEQDEQIDEHMDDTPEKPEANNASSELHFVECKKCKLSFEKYREYLVHIRSPEHQNVMTARVECSVCGANVHGPYLPTHMERIHSDVRRYVCDVCGRRFVTSGAFKQHALTHTTLLEHPCPDCPYRGRTRYNLKLHRRKHTGEKPYACTQCAMRCVTKSNLNNHMVIHNKQFALKCGECKKGFHRQIDLINHQTHHTGIKDHKCDTCGKEFGNRRALTKHTKKVHHRVAGPKGRVPLYIQYDKNKLSEQSNE